MHGAGSQTRSFCDVLDIINGICRLMMSDFVELVNIENPEEVSALEFVEMVIEITRSDSRIVFEDLSVGNPKVQWPDISRAKEFTEVGVECGAEGRVEEDCGVF